MLDGLLILAAGAVPSGEEVSAVSKILGQYGIKPSILIAQAINFCIVAFLLYRFAFKPVLATIDERQKKIADGLQYAEEMKTKLTETEKQQAEILRQASQEAQNVVAESREQAKTLLEKETQAAVTKAEDIIKKAQAATVQEREQMLKEVRAEIAQLVVQTTEKVLAKQLSEQDRSQFNEAAAKALVSQL